MKIRLSDGKSTVSKKASEFTSDNVGVVKLTQLAAHKKEVPGRTGDYGSYGYSVVWFCSL